MSKRTALKPEGILDPCANIHEFSLLSPVVLTNPGKAWQNASRNWQGIPSIERTRGGLLFAAWYTGGKGEGSGNYIPLIRSRDNGRKWSKPLLVIAPEHEICREYDPAIWLDPKGRLWLFWGQSYTWYNGRAGVWYMRCDNPDDATMRWTEPVRISDGVMMNKPTVLSDGTWMLPIAIWGVGTKLPELESWACPLAVVTTDDGKSWKVRGKAEVKQSVRSFDEHMFIELKDKTLWMLIRTQWGIGRSVSKDGGKTWTYCRPSGLTGVDSRFFIRRSSTGRLILISNNDPKMDRKFMTAFVSEDEGKTWGGGLLLDERNGVSYPDAAEDGNGRWFVIYDHGRGDQHWPGDPEIMMADFTEEEVLAGKLTRKASALKIVVDSLKKK